MRHRRTQQQVLIARQVATKRVVAHQLIHIVLSRVKHARQRRSRSRSHRLGDVRLRQQKMKGRGSQQTYARTRGDA